MLTNNFCALPMQRVAFEYEKGSNIDQVERMHAMERNLISMAREVEKLRAEVLNAEKRARGMFSYCSFLVDISLLWSD